MQEWLRQNSPVDGEDLERHDKWLCMMWPRLHLLRELLSDDGAIFVSIDDNEQHHLRMIMDEIFGEDNFRNCIAIRRGAKNVQAQFKIIDSLSSGWEYIMFYSKFEVTKFKNLRIQIEQKETGSWNNHWRGTDRPTMRYELFGDTPKSGQWRWSKERSYKAIANYLEMENEIGKSPPQELIDEWWFSQSPNKPDLLRLSKTNKPEHYIPSSNRKIVSSLWTDMTANESSNLSNLLIDNSLNNPKRTDLIKRIIEFITSQSDDSIILDSFAGSGTTAHAVLALNKEDGGNRKFIMAECEDYADTITAERVRRVIKGVPEIKDPNLREGLGGSFTYCTLGDPIDIEEMLTGKSLPTYSELAAYLLHTASGISSGQQDLASQNEDGLFYSSDTTDYYLLYENSLDWLRSNDAIFKESHANQIFDQNQASDKRAVVFAAGKYMGQRDLTAKNITFCQLPYEMHRSE